MPGHDRRRRKGSVNLYQPLLDLVRRQPMQEIGKSLPRRAGAVAEEGGAVGQLGDGPAGSRAGGEVFRI
jgi:hypothetical protein